MPDSLVYQLNNANPYGPIPANTNLSIRAGYTAIVGQNDVGKSSLLQWIFGRLIRQHNSPLDSVALIQTDRFYITPHTRTTETLRQFNQILFQTVENSPRDSAGVGNITMHDLFACLIQRTDFMRQAEALNVYLDRLGFPPLALRTQQVAFIGDSPVSAHGAGMRCLLPVLAALTSPDIRILLIDEPELSLEARTQKVLKQLLLEAVGAGKTIVAATQSHLFLNRAANETNQNYQLTRSANGVQIEPTITVDSLLDLTYNLLGNSLEDLFFPNNFLVVEGSSDQCIVERVAALLEIPSHTVKIIAARGIDKVLSAYEAMTHTLVPLITPESPYA